MRTIARWRAAAAIDPGRCSGCLLAPGPAPLGRVPAPPCLDRVPLSQQSVSYIIQVIRRLRPRHCCTLAGPGLDPCGIPAAAHTGTMRARCIR
jgi:hypothetical protein